MARITLEDLEVTSFVTGAAAPSEDWGGIAQVTVRFCICTADISTCSRTSVAGGCDTSVQCVTG